MGVSEEGGVGIMNGSAPTYGPASSPESSQLRSGSGIPGKSTRSGAAPTPSEPAEREAALREALDQAHKALALLDRETPRLEAAFSVRDFAATRASADAARSLQRSLRGSLERAKAAGAKVAEVALISRRADALDQRLAPVLRQAPPMPSDLGVNLIDPMADLGDEKAWRARLAGRTEAPEAPQSSQASQASEAEPSAADSSESAGPVTEAPDGSLPDGVDYQWIPGTFRVRVRKAWVRSAITGPLGRSAIPPERLRELLSYLRTVGALHWVSDEAIKRTADELAIPSLAHGPMMDFELPVQALRTLGLPPSVRTVVDLDGANGLIVVMQLGAPAPPAARSVQLSAAQRRQLVEKIEDFFGVPMDAPSRAAFLHKTDVACKVQSGAISLRFSPADLAWLFSEPMVQAMMEAGVDSAGSWKKLAAASAVPAGPSERRKKSAGRGKKPAAATAARPPASAEPAVEEAAETQAAPTEAASATATSTAEPKTSSPAASPSAPPTATAEPAASPALESSLSTGSTSKISEASTAPTPPRPAPELSTDEQATVRDWLAQHLPLGAGSSPSHTVTDAADDTAEAAPSRYLLEQIRAVDAHPQRALILERLRATDGGARKGEPLTGRALDEVIGWAEHEAARRIAGLAEQPPDDASAAARPPVFDFPVPAVLLHNATAATSSSASAAGYATAAALAGEELRFWIDVDWPQEMSGAQKQEHVFRDRVAECEWVFERAGATGASSGPGSRFVARTRGKEPSHRQAFELDPGSGASEETWTLQAFVRHSYFRPARLALTFQVKSERRHLEEQQRAHFADLGGAATTQDESFGEGTYDAGRVFTGELPKDFQRRTPAQRRQQLEQEIARLTELRAYLAREARHPDAITSCDRQLEALRDTIADLDDDDRDGWQPFEARAFFVGRGEHSLDGPLDLAASTKTEETADGVVTAVQLRDLSRRLSAEDYRFTATGKTFEQALKLAFYDLAKKYPRGKVSLLAERVAKQGETIGFELDTGTDWEDLKEDVFDPVVSAAVNIGAAVVMIFAPATIPVLMPLTIAYNSSQTIDQMADAWTSGTLTPGQGALSLAEIGLNLLPLVGRVPIIQTSKLAFAMYQIGDAAGQALVMTLQAQRQIASLRDQDIAQMAGSYAELVELQKSAHPSDPRVAKKRAALDLRAQALRARTLEVWGDLVAQQAIAMAPVRLAGAIEHHLTTSHLASLRAKTLLVDRPGETPHYDPQRGQILGDTRQLDATTSARLHAELDAHQSALAGELAGDLGLPRDRVAIQPGDKLALASDGDGVIATLPPGTSPTEALRGWSEHAASMRDRKSHHAAAPEGAANATSPKPGDSRESEAAPNAKRGPIALLGDDDRARNAERLPPLEGFTDVYIHSDGDTMEINYLGRDIVISSRDLARFLISQGLEGKNVRLVACKSGDKVLSIARDVAHALGGQVYAPTNNVWVARGDHGIGDKFGDKTGEWRLFQKLREDELPYYREQFEKRNAAKQRAGDPTKIEDGDLDLAQSVHQPHFDRRENISASSAKQMEALGKTLGAKIRVDPEMTDGVTVAARRVLLGDRPDLEVTEIRVGPRALVEDVLAHRTIIAEITRYNGVLGKLRRLADAVKEWATKKRRFPRGSLGWQTEQELGKLDELLAARKSLLEGDKVNEAALKAEIKFLEGRQVFHRDVLRSVEETTLGDQHGSLSFEKPDTGSVTRDALKDGYRLPGAEEGADPNWYYYRNSSTAPGAYELVRKPDAPHDAPALSARLVGDKFQGFKPIDSRTSTEIPHEVGAPEVITHLRATSGFSKYADMLESHGLASHSVVDGLIRNVLDRRRMSARAEVTYEAVRHEVKEHFRERLHAYLCDPALDEASSWARLRAVVTELGPADRGALAETWYRSRHLPKGRPHVPVFVERTGGLNPGMVERRNIDIVDGKTAVEVKDVAGPIDREQFDAYVDMLQRTEESSDTEINKLTYVFTNPEGAIANLEFLAKEMERKILRDKLTIETFDQSGKKLSARTSQQAIDLLKRLKEKNL
jgi:hypothetical protein